jgi:hypothetical protein
MAQAHLVDRLSVSVEVRDILVQHLQWLGERTPSLAIRAMRVASSSHVWPGLVNSAVDQESRRVSWQAHVASDRFAVVVNKNHITRFQQSEVLGQRIGPECVRVFWITHRDVAGHAFGVAFACEDTEGESHLGKHPLAVFGVRRECWDSWETLALGDEFQSTLGLFMKFTSFGVLYHLFWGNDGCMRIRLGDCGGCHDD